MEEIHRFVGLAQSGRFTVTELCEQFGISRKTGYKHWERYASEGDRRTGSCLLTDRPKSPGPLQDCETKSPRVLDYAPSSQPPAWLLKRWVVRVADTDTRGISGGFSGTL